MTTMTVQKTRVTCKKCGKASDIETVANCPIEVFQASIKAATCPHCGAGYKSLSFGGEINDGKPETHAPIAERIRWWIDNGDIGISSNTILIVFTGRSVIPGCTPDRNVPRDPADFHRCKKLLDLIPEWRGELQRVKDKLPWWAPMIDNWAEMERLFEIEEARKWKPPHDLYEFMRTLVEQCDESRRGEA